MVMEAAAAAAAAAAAMMTAFFKTSARKPETRGTWTCVGNMFQ